jgi:Leucine-rich repeat (LRR) protein
MQGILSAKNVMRVLRCIGVRKDSKPWDGRVPLLNRFPYIRLLSLSVREHTFSMSLPPLNLDLGDLPSSLTYLRLYCDNSVALLEDKKTNSVFEGAVKYHDIGALLPNLRTLELSGSPSSNIALSKIRWPDSLSSLSVPKGIVSHNELATMSPSLTSVTLGEVTYRREDEVEGALLPFSPNLEELTVACRDTYSSSNHLIYHFDMLPANLKFIRLNIRGHIPNSSIPFLPITLTAIEFPMASLDVKMISHLANLQKLAFEAKSTPPNISHLLPRKIIRLVMRHYNHVNDEFWIGLPRGLTSLNVLNLSRTPGPVNNLQHGAMTAECIQYVPHLLQTLDLMPIVKPLDGESVAKISDSVQRLKILEIESDAVMHLPRRLKSLELNHMKLTKEWIEGLPPHLEQLRAAWATITDPSALSYFPPKMTDLKIMHHRTGEMGIFTSEMASYLPQTLRRLSIRCINEIGDSFMAALNVPGLVHLELRSDHAAFTDAVIHLLPRRLTWLDLYGCDAWTYAPEALLGLPRTLTWCYIHFRDNSNLKLLPVAQITPYLPPLLEHHSIPSIEKPPGQYW